MKNVGECWMCVYQNGSDYLLFAASMMCAHFNYKTPDRRAAAGSAGCSPLSVKINLSPVFVSSRILSVPCNFRIHLTLSSSSRATTAATPRQLRGPPADSSFEPSSFVRFLVFSARQYFTRWQPPAACMCRWCSDVSIIAEVQKHSGCQNILNSFIISAKNNCFEIIKLFVSEASSWLIMSICSGALHWLPRQADTWATK